MLRGVRVMVALLKNWGDQSELGFKNSELVFFVELSASVNWWEEGVDSQLLLQTLSCDC